MNGKSAIIISFLTLCTVISPDALSQEIDDSAITAKMFRDIPAGLVREDTVTLSFIGDVMLHSAQIRAAHARWAGRHGKVQSGSPSDTQFDFSTFFRHIRDIIEGADIAVANMEFTLGGSPYTGYPSFSAPDSYAQYAAGCGIDIFLTANNHILDKGEKGLLRTLDVYREMEEHMGIRFTGAAADRDEKSCNNPLYVISKGMKFAFINMTYGTNAGIGKEFPGAYLISRNEASASIGKAREDGADLIIVLPHWGMEYTTSHSQWQRGMAQMFASCGADLVVGTHPHVVQDFETIDTGKGEKVPVIYSLGNAVSNMSAANTQIGLLAEIQVIRDISGKIFMDSPDFIFLWCSLPGGLCDCHTVIPVKNFIGKREEWGDKRDYDKMIDTYYRVKRTTGIQD